MSLTIPDICYSIYIKVPSELVYPAITSADGWNAWFTQDTTLDFKPGGEIRLRWRDWGVDHVTLEDGGPIVDIVPNRVFAFQWSRGSRPTTVKFLLEPLGPGTRLTVTDAGYQESQKDLDDCVICAAGWGEALALLKFYLEHGVVYGPVPG